MWWQGLNLNGAVKGHGIEMLWSFVVCYFPSVMYCRLYIINYAQKGENTKQKNQCKWLMSDANCSEYLRCCVELNLFAAFMCFQGRHITSPFWIQTTSCVKKCFVYNAVGTFTCRMKPSIQIGISNSCCLCQVQMEWKLLRTSSLCLPNNHRFSCLSADVYPCLEVTGSHLAPWYLYSIIL